jgi:hypothetical protein
MLGKFFKEGSFVNGERICVYIPVEEYRELVRAKTVAECLIKAIEERSLSYAETDLLCKMFSQEESGEAE